MAIDNLKIIHDMHRSGSILELLRRLRASRVILEDFYKRLNNKLAEIKQVKENEITAEERAKRPEVEIFPEPPEEVITEPDPEPTPPIPVQEKQKPELRQNNAESNHKDQTKYRNFNERPQNFNRNSNYSSGQQYDRQQSQNSGKLSPTQRYDRPQRSNQGLGGYKSNQHAGGQKPLSSQKPFNGPSRAQGQGGFNRTQGQGNGKFISTKANNFRSFKDAPTESSAVLASPERNHGNKNKTRVYQGDEKKSQIRKQQDFNRSNNVLIEDEHGFEEARMGSRKLIKGKKKDQSSFIAPKIENAVITTDNVSVKILSERIGKTATEIIKKLMLIGVMANINSTIDFQTAELIAGELGVKLEQKLEKTFEEQLIEVSTNKSDGELIRRPPIVTVMGHVDHGKTSLLDALRRTKVVEGEAGGITQKIGAYQISAGGEKITFIDTPGHAAFSAMRARGAKATDIAILVVAADDGIMPQTIEAINHIKSAGVPMIVAINKMDKPDANPQRIKQQLADNDVLPEEWGGDAIIVQISAKTGLGLDELIKTILLVSEVEDFKASANSMAVGIVIEAELDKNRGPVASIIVQNGTLRVGDNVVSGLTFGKVKAMYDENGMKLDKAGPSTPVVVLGFNEVPISGDQAFAVDEKLSKQVIAERKNKIKEERTNKTSGVTIDDFMNKVNEGKLKLLNIIVKADTQGSVEALVSTLETIRNEEVKVHIVHSGAGTVTESDVVLASASGSIIICFNQKVNPKAKLLAEQTKVEIREYKIIYEIVDEITKIINDMMTVKYEPQIIGHGEIRLVFKLSSHGIIAGTYVTDGHVLRGSFAKIKRGEEEIGISQIESLRVVKDEKAEVNHGFECGIKFKDSIALKEGDTFEFFINVPIKRK